MEGEAVAHNSSGKVDKMRVLDVKPLRTLVPIYPTNVHAPPFVCSSPFGPYPPGFSPFYPFSSPPSGTPDLNQGTTSYPTPLRSYRAPQENGDLGDDEDGLSNGPQRSAGRASKSASSSNKKPKKVWDFDSVSSAVSDKFVVGISPSQRDDGDRELVISVLMRFDAVKRKFCQLEESNGASNGITRQANLKSASVLMSKGMRTNMRKRMGVVPGVQVGDIFFFRMEMCLVGLHSLPMAGIDYMMLKNDIGEEPVAISIVSSSGYDDEVEDPNILIYTGQGGNNKDKPAADQKLERGNLALERSLQRGNEVRVSRGIIYNVNLQSKVYMYDGLFTIQESWVERGKSGCNIFKYKLVRVPGQPAAFGNWKSIEKWKGSISSRVGQLAPDLTSGAELIPVSLVNEVDGDTAPTSFSYIPSLKYATSSKSMGPSSGCSCRSACQPGDPNCSCAAKNGGAFPYTSSGVLVSPRPMLYECGPSCPCSSNCKNRVSHTGLKARFEVFKTKDKGWGLQSWDPIRAGTFICEYAGEVLHGSIFNGNDDYIFDTSRVYQPFRWNCEPGILEEDGSDSPEEYNVPFPLVITSRNSGNIARFMNHSCSPNVFWQPVMYDDNDESFLHITFFAMRHIPPLTELTYDYGASQRMPRGKNRCSCGSSKCRGYFG